MGVNVFESFFKSIILFVLRIQFNGHFGSKSRRNHNQTYTLLLCTISMIIFLIISETRMTASVTASVLKQDPNKG